MLYKYKNLCETNDPYHFKERIDNKYLKIEEIKRRIENKEDLIGRDDNFKKISIDKSFPDFLLSNLKKYSDWII